MVSLLDFKKCGFIKKEKEGVTLVELLITMAIMSMAMAAIYGVFSSTQRSHAVNRVSAELQQEMRISIDFMVRDIRMAGLDPDATANAGITTADDTEIEFTADRNMDGDIDTSDFETIRYRLNGTDLEQRLYGNDSTQVAMTTNVSSLDFNYLDGNGANIATPVTSTNLDNIRTVVVNMVVQNTARYGGTDAGQRRLTARIKCRNLGL